MPSQLECRPKRTASNLVLEADFGWQLELYRYHEPKGAFKESKGWPS